MQAVPGGANYWDLGLLEGNVRLVYSAKDQDGRVREWDVELPIPEETMDELEQLIGDGNATVTVGKELKVSEDYRTAASTAWVKLTCNQDLQTILKAREIGTALALGFAQQGYEQARFVLDKMAGLDAEPPPPLIVEAVDGEVGAEAQTISRPKKVKPKAKNQDPEPHRKQRPGPGPRPILSGKNKPSFRR